MLRLFVHVPYALVPDSHSSYTLGHKSKTKLNNFNQWNMVEQQINNKKQNKINYLGRKKKEFCRKKNSVRAEKRTNKQYMI